MATNWVNADGLLVKFDKEGTTDVGGEYQNDGNPDRIVEIKLAFGDITSVAGTVPGSGTGMTLPKGAIVRLIETWAETPLLASGGSATFDLGLIRQDFATELDYNGLVAAMAKSVWTVAGLRTTIFSASDTYAGALFGAVLPNAGVICCNYNTTAFTSGKVVFRIYYYLPVSGTGHVG